MAEKTTLHAVVWLDFVPLSLPKPSAAEAVATAKAMYLKAIAAGTALVDLRAVTLNPDDTLDTLWRPEA